MEDIISSSETVITCSTLFLTIGHVKEPILVSSPSATVFGAMDGCSVPVSNDLFASSAPLGSAANTRMSFLIPYVNGLSKLQPLQ